MLIGNEFFVIFAMPDEVLFDYFFATLSGIKGENA